MITRGTTQIPLDSAPRYSPKRDQESSMRDIFTAVDSVWTRLKALEESKVERPRVKSKTEVVTRGSLLTGQGKYPQRAELLIGKKGEILLSDGEDVLWSSPFSAGIQPLDPDLTAIAALTGTGILCHIGASSWIERNITSTCGLSVTNPAGIAGNINIGLTTNTPQFAGLGLGRALTAWASLDVYGVGNNDGVAHFNTIIADSNAQYAEVGGGIALQGKYTDAGAVCNGAGIQAYKINATTGNNAFGLKLWTRANGGNPTVGMTLTDAQDVTFVGTLQALRVGVGVLPDATASLKLNDVADLAGNFLTIASGVVNYRTPAEALADMGGSPADHSILSATHGDTTAAAVVRGDVMVGIGATPKWTRYAISVPVGAALINVFGIVNGETEPTWKAALDSTNPTTITAAATIGPGTSLIFAHRDHQHTLNLDANERLLGRGSAGAGTVEEMTLASTAGLNLAYGAGTLNIGSTADTPQFSALSLGKVLAAGYLIDAYSAASDAIVQTYTDGNDKYALFRADADGDCQIGMIAYGDGYAPGNIMGVSKVGATMLYSVGATAMAIGTYGAVPLVLATNDVTAITIGSTQAVTCASTLQALRGGFGTTPHATIPLLVEKDTGGTYNASTVAAIFGDTDSLDNVYIIGNTINTGFGENTSNQSLCINYRGYDGGTTQGRNFVVFDGKGNYVQYSTGATLATQFYGTLQATSVSSIAPAATAGTVYISANAGAANQDKWKLDVASAFGTLTIQSYITGSWVPYVNFVAADGDVHFPVNVTCDGTLGVTGLTASRLMASSASKTAVSVANLASWVAGTANQITVTDDTDGTITLSLPQNIHTAATPQFAQLGIGIAVGDTNLITATSAADAVSRLITSADDHYSRVLAEASNGIIAGNLYAFGSTYAGWGGTLFGVAVAGYVALIDSSAGNGLLVGTTTNKQVIIGTNSTAAITISTAQAVTCASTLQATGLSVGGALPANTLIYGISAASLARLNLTASANNKQADILLYNDSPKYVNLAIIGSAAVGNWAGVSYADMAYFGTDASALAIGTTAASAITLITNNTAAITISTAQAVTCASTLQATKGGFGAAPDASYILTVSDTGDNVARFITTRNLAGTSPIYFCNRRGSANVLDNDSMSIYFQNDSDTTQGAIQGRIQWLSADVTHASRNGRMIFHTMDGGSDVSALTLSGGGAGTFAGTVQATGFSVGRALSAGYNLDLYNATTNQYPGMLIQGDTCQVEFGCGNSAVGASWQDKVYINAVNNANGFHLMTGGQFVLQTNGSTTAITVSTAQAVTCASYLECNSYAAIYGLEAGDGTLFLYSDQGDENADKFSINASTGDYLQLRTYGTGSWVAGLEMASDADIFSLGIATNTSASAANVYIDSITYEIFRSTSSRRYKGDIQTLMNSDRIYNLRPVTFRERVMRREKVTLDEMKDTASRRIVPTDELKPGVRIGLIAEEVADVMPEMVDYDKDGQPDGVHYAMLVAPLIAEIKKLRERVVELEKAA